jgi:DME family drug/metabolite transporter
MSSKPVPAKDLSAPPTAQAWRGRLLVFTAAVLWSTSGFFAKAKTFDGWPGGLLACWRALFASLVILPLVRRPQWSWWLVPMVVCFVAMMWSYLTAMRMGQAATAIWLQSTAPVWALLVGVGFFGERFHRRDGVLTLLGLAGVGVILYFELGGSQSSAVIFGLASGVFYAAVIICLRQLRHVDAAWLAFVNHGCTVLCLAPYLYFCDASHWPQGVQWIYLIAFGALQIGIPYVLFAQGLRDVSGHEAGGIALIEPVLVPIWTWLAWGERISPHVLCGAALIFVGLAWRYLGSRTAVVTPEQLKQAVP